MDDDTVRVAVGLRLGTCRVCGPHNCKHCETVVDALSCRKSEGRHQRHAALNDTFQRALNICSYSFEAGANGANEGGWKEA